MMTTSLNARRFAAFVLAAALVAASCGGSQDAGTGGVMSAATAVTAVDFGARPPGGGPRPGADVNTSVGSAHATKPWSVESASVEQEFVNSTGLARRNVGAPELVRDPTLDAYARDHAAAMSAAGRIYHSNIGVLLGVWWSIGENVGAGPDAGKIQAAYLASPGHLQNLTNPAYTHFGVGVFIDPANRIWCVQDYAA